MKTVTTERVPMSELKEGDIVHEHGMRIRISGGKRRIPREHYNDTYSWFHGEIINDFHPYGWKDRDWTVQSADWVEWAREV